MADGENYIDSVVAVDVVSGCRAACVGGGAGCSARGGVSAVAAGDIA